MNWTAMGIRLVRRQLNMNQREFWERLHINQAAGSRYEQEERPLPVWLHQLLTVAYGSSTASGAEIRRLRGYKPIAKRERALSRS
jgi:hypothetical protein